MNLVIFSYYYEEYPGIWVHYIATQKSIEAIEKMREQPFSD